MSEKIKTVSRQDEVAKDESEILDIFSDIAQNKKLVIFTGIIFFIIGTAYSLVRTPTYQADALVQVEKNSADMLLKDLKPFGNESQAIASTEIEIMYSRMIIGKTVEQLGLRNTVEQKYSSLLGKGWAKLRGEKSGTIDIDYLELPPDWEVASIDLIYLGKDEYQVEKEGNLLFKGKVGTLINRDGVALKIKSIQSKVGDVYTVTRNSELTAIDSIKSRLVIAEKSAKSGMIGLSITGDDPALTRETLNSILTNYLQQNTERKSEKAAKSLEFVKEQMPRVKSSLNQAEDKLNDYRKRNDSIDLSLEAKAALDISVAIQNQLNELTFKEAEISQKYTTDHPIYRALLDKRKTLLQEQSRVAKRIASLPATQQEVVRLSRDVESGQQIYMQLLNNQEELSLTKASAIGNVRIIDYATLQDSPVSSRGKIIIFISTFIGLIISITYVLTKKIFFIGIESSTQLDDMGVNVYASVPVSDWQQRVDKERGNDSRTKLKSSSCSLLAMKNPADISIEAIRNLRTSLHFAMIDARNNVLMISGPSPGVGKTFVSLNLASVIAQSEVKVLFIDCDMRRGYTHKILGNKNECGLSEYLSGKVNSFDDIISTGDYPFDFISRGATPPNPSELLMRERFPSLVNWAGEQYDLVIVDTPPILAVTDASIIGKLAGTSLMVVRYGLTNDKEVYASLKRFELNNVEIKGVVLNAARKNSHDTYNSYVYE
ncbi:polysaccharide biosynthesis tyrosine autokinase [Serratia marcescens]|uniref:polysaccharide biosynthesis tyrosine autokinase n=2 Tax=Serratia marcescens TaxID=615 RepID=UPI001F14DB27|nr:polysaccharide biosynthesis tyrosine autokinase [Serratia marcescens]MDP8614544.1 polysaccharide biosynthesis tyrosine autokinase [Serratia marcescens]MDP8644599.1 polysaccharide biosynthesis tyrosine autokinase [Serratia marcescens]MDP8654531.1 polysaccharide biosynthesis tyrosine autokinase [Serratia marcescens]MDP8659494.1 polysaccharide biosynthesis tyrosine autokinase [Serratia marcescens]MDP8718740.1 polysaccharide biosynthesis tyrosine autokinase [Serratia marcescens]